MGRQTGYTIKLTTDPIESFRNAVRDYSYCYLKMYKKDQSAERCDYFYEAMVLAVSFGEHVWLPVFDEQGMRRLNSNCDIER